MDTTQAILTSLLRTVVPVIVGAALSIPILGDSVDPGALEVVVTGAVTGVYYAIVRVLETKVAPAFGWLLGAPRAPEYQG